MGVVGVAVERELAATCGSLFRMLLRPRRLVQCIGFESHAEDFFACVVEDLEPITFPIIPLDLRKLCNFNLLASNIEGIEHIVESIRKLPGVREVQDMLA